MTIAAETSRGVIKIVPITGGVGVIADNTWRAFKAASLIKPDWGPAPYPPSTRGACSQTVAASFTASIARTAASRTMATWRRRSRAPA